VGSLQGFSRSVDILSVFSSNCRAKYSEHQYIGARPVANARDSFIPNIPLHFYISSRETVRFMGFHKVDIFEILYIEIFKLVHTFCNTLGFIKIQCSKFLFAYGKGVQMYVLKNSVILFYKPV
jgi:hypothetical protein